MTVIFRAVDPGELTWIYRVQREWIAKEGRYSVIVDRSVRGEEADRIARNAPFNPFG